MLLFQSELCFLNCFQMLDKMFDFATYFGIGLMEVRQLEACDVHIAVNINRLNKLVNKH